MKKLTKISTVLEHQLTTKSGQLRRGTILVLGLLGAGCLRADAQASALTGYYTAVAAGDPDFYGGVNAPVISIMSSGMVASQLGPDGLPVLSASGITALGSAADMNASHELLWWSAGKDPYVSLDPHPVSIDTLPFAFGYPNVNWYVTGQSSDQSYFRTVHWQGTFNMASVGQISLSMSVDDDVWVFIDGKMVTEDHYGNAASASPTESAGKHSIDIFYDDRFPVYDGFNFSSSVTLSPVPEPGTVGLLVAGALSVLVWKKRKS